jgi:hypothetical protein
MVRRLLCVVLLVLASRTAVADAIEASVVSDDWVRQAVTQDKNKPLTAEDDAAGGCDGVKDGKAGFHTQKGQNPWWQVDLGSAAKIGRIVIWNRTQTAPATQRARRLVVWFSADGKKWDEIYRHDGALFYGFSGGKPLTISASGKSARFVRVGLADNEYFHLDEVEVFAAENPKKNLALDRPATQSSISKWSTPRKKAISKSFRDAAREALKLATATRTLMAGSDRIASYDIALAGLQKRFDKVVGDTEFRKLYIEIRRLRRKLILSHPALDFERLLINKRPPPNAHAHMCEQYLGRNSAAGPGLVILDSWKNNPRQTVLLKGKLPKGSVLHPDLSFDAKRVLFSFCDHTVVNGDNVTIPTQGSIRKRYNYQKIGARPFLIYEASIDGKNVRQLTGTASDPMKTAYDRATVLVEDLDPCYLPGGGFVFTSTRNQSFGRCHGGVYKPAFLLYRADANGSDIRPISFAEANEWDPSVLPDGRIIYTRWDYINRHNTWFQSLWVTNPDGTGTAHYYGNYTKNPCVIAEARAIPGTRKVVATAAAHHFVTGGSVILVDPMKGQDGLGPLTRITPEVKFPETEGWGGKGCFATPYPLSEELFLAAYSPEPINYGVRPSDAAFGIYLVDSLGGRELIHRDPNVSSFTPIPVRSTPKPRAIPSLLPPPGKGPATGTCYIQDIYRSTQPITKGSIQSLRINRIHDQPTARFTLRSRARQEVVKSVIGVVPVEQDGSVGFSVPANVGFQLQALDKNGMAVMTMRSLMYVRPGETVSCVGCHEPRGKAPYPGAAKKSVTIHAPRPVPGAVYEGGFSFDRTVQPVLDRHCIGCHGLKTKPEAGLNLLAGRAYLSLTKPKGLVAIALSNHETFSSKPKDYFAHAGRLAKLLLKGKMGNQQINIPRDDLERIITWLDLNAQQYGDYSFNRVETREASPDGEKRLRKYIGTLFGSKLAAQPFGALVNVGQPNESRILMAPLSSKAGGWGQIKKGTWATRKDPAYQKMIELVNTSIVPLEYTDIKGTCGRAKCVCNSCWVRKLNEQRASPTRTK